MNEKLEKLNRELAKGEARVRRAQHEEKILLFPNRHERSCCGERERAGSWETPYGVRA